MDRDTPDKFDQFSGSNYRPLFRQSESQENGQQPNFSSFNQPNSVYGQSNEGNQANTPSSQWNLLSGMNNPGNNNSPANGRPDQVAAQGNQSSGLKLTPQEAKLLKECSSQGFWYFSLPSVFGYLCYSQYNSVKKLKPLTNPAMIWQSIFVFFATKMLWTPVCWNRLYSKSPDFKQRIEKLKVDNSAKQPAYFQQTPQSGFSSPKSSFPQTPYTSPQQSSNKEFVDDDYDVSGYSKEEKWMK